jgi:hypothetical protein
MPRTELVRTSAFAAIATVAALTAGAAPPLTKVRHVRGNIVSQLLSGPACPSPVGLCTQGTFTGSIRGEFVFVATSLTPSGDSSATGVVHYTGEIRIKTAGGEIFIKDSGAFDAVPGSTGDVGAVSTIVGGTASYTGVSGRIRIAGTFTPDAGGDSEYSGQLVLP